MMTTTNDEGQGSWRWSSHSFQAMNTTVQVRLYSQITHAQILADVQRLFHSFEKRLSRFDPDSELSRLNRAQQCEFRASPILVEAVEVALWAAQATNGLYDPTILKDLEQAGYRCSFEQMKETVPLDQTMAFDEIELSEASARRLFSFRSVELNRARREISKPVGLALDLGGMGKGWIVDRAADRLQGLGPFLVNAGGDLYAYHAPPHQRGWPIDLVHPLRPDRLMAKLTLHHRALATSTIAKRRWRQTGQIMHHLIDPRTGRPAQTDAISVTVVADRTVTAEVYAKAALILGANHGLAFLERLPGVEGLIFTQNSEIVYTDGLADLLENVEADGYVHNVQAPEAASPSRAEAINPGK